MKLFRYLSSIFMVFFSTSLAFAQTPGDKLTDFAIQKVDAVIDGVQKALPTVTKYALEVTSLNCVTTLIGIQSILLVIRSD